MKPTNSPTPTKIHRPPSAQHRRQVVWQIAVPIGVTILLIAAVATLSVVQSGGDFEASLHWANISAILLISPVLGMSLVVLILLALCIFGISRLLKAIPDFFFKIFTYFELAKDYVRAASNWLVKPILTVNTWSKQTHTLFARVIHPNK